MEGTDVFWLVRRQLATPERKGKMFRSLPPKRHRIGPTTLRVRVAVPILALIFVGAFVMSGCGPNRSEWMAHAATTQATRATESIGTPQEVRIEARQGAEFLGALAGAAQQQPKIDPRVAASIVQDTGEVGSGLSAIADSKTDADFTNAVFAMCDATRRAAEPRVGQILLSLAGRFEANPPSNQTPERRQAAVTYLTTFGNRLIAIPAECDQSSSAMAEASTEEQQAEVQHQANVSRALTAAALVFAGTALVAGEVGAAAATRPPVQNNYVYVNQVNGY